MIISALEAKKLAKDIFIKAGTPEPTAEIVADALLQAELQGLPSHGFSRIPFYADQAISGKIVKDAKPVVTNPAAACVCVDAANGFAFPAIEAGLEKAKPLAREYGVSAMTVTRSHHCGVLGLYAEKIAQEGLLGLIFSNTPAAMAPFGGNKASFGTNPIAFGCPRKNGEPIIIDLSLSKVARGKVMNAKQKGEAIPEGWALDENGKPTTNPDEALKGTMVPMGDAKGAALALMVEILCGALTGANYAFEASSFFEAEGPAPGIGQTFIMIYPYAFNNDFSDKLQILIQHMTGQPGVRLPGAKRFMERKKRLAEGVAIPDALYEKLRSRLTT